jgi:hypothetical protein
MDVDRDERTGGEERHHDRGRGEDEAFPASQAPLSCG